MKTPEEYMRLALKEAEKAAEIDEVPVGAIIVDENGKILAKAHNLREKTNDPTAHAEILAIRKATKKRKSWRLADCSIFVTVEPCSMCAGCMVWTRIKNIYYGAKDIKGGALGGSYNLFEMPNINHRPNIFPNILVKECSTIIKDYFKKKR